MKECYFDWTWINCECVQKISDAITYIFKKTKMTIDNARRKEKRDHIKCPIKTWDGGERVENKNERRMSGEKWQTRKSCKYNGHKSCHRYLGTDCTKKHWPYAGSHKVTKSTKSRKKTRCLCLRFGSVWKYSILSQAVLSLHVGMSIIQGVSVYNPRLSNPPPPLDAQGTKIKGIEETLLSVFYRVLFQASKSAWRVPVIILTPQSPWSPGAGELCRHTTPSWDHPQAGTITCATSLSLQPIRTA